MNLGNNGAVLSAKSIGEAILFRSAALICVSKAYRWFLLRLPCSRKVAIADFGERSYKDLHPLDACRVLSQPDHDLLICIDM